MVAGALTKIIKKATKEMPNKLKMSKSGALRQKVKQAEKSKALRELGNRIKDIEKSLKRKNMDSGLRKTLTKDLEILRNKRKTGNYAIGGVISKIAKKVINKKPTSTRDIQTKVLNKAKKQGMTAKNFRMQNPNDKDVKSLYKANPNLKVKDVDRLKMRKIEEANNKKLVTTAKGKALLKERRKQKKKK